MIQLDYPRERMLSDIGASGAAPVLSDPGDPALERRFQKVVVRELGELETLEILQARKERLERHHNVLISEEALIASVKLTEKNRQSIDLVAKKSQFKVSRVAVANKAIELGIKMVKV